jgi:TonB-linked SusC/RagA family outer membrane protein
MEKKSDYSERRLYCILSKQTIRVMKLTTLFTLMTIFQLYASDTYSQLTKITLKVENDKISDVLKKIEDKSEYYFLYSPKLINVEKRVSINVKDEAIKTILTNIFDEEVKFEIYNRQIILTKEEIIPVSVVVLQKNTVTGTVTDESGATLPGVSIQIEGTSIGTVSDANGKYIIDLPSESGVLIFTFIGYTAQKVAVKGGTTVNVTMILEAQKLDEIVVIGYGTVKKRDLTGSVASVKGAELKAVVASNVMQSLAGRATGVQVIQNTGAPGASVSVRIRGANSIQGSNEPLYVIDGFPYAGSNPSVLSNDDIQSVEILKDASATAIYGSRGANGVVLITTKRGKAGITTVDFETSYGMQSISNKLELMNAEEYAVFNNQVFVNDGKPAYFSQNDIAGFGEGYDWQNLGFQSAPVFNNTLSINGGNDKTQFSVSGSFFNQQGLVNGSEYKKYSIRAFLNHDISKFLSLEYGVTLTKNSDARKNSFGQNRGQSLLDAILESPPTLTPYNADGTYRVLSTAYPFIANVLTNPLNFINEQSDLGESNNILANAALNIKPIPDLTLRIYGGIQNTDYRSDYYQTLLFVNSPGSASQSASNTLSLLNENTLSYNKTISEKHTVSALVGFTYQDFTYKYLAASGDGFLSDVPGSYDLGGSSSPGIPQSSYQKSVLLSNIGRVNYSFDGKYLLTASIRADGSSKYSEGNKWGYFPSAALKWNVIKEGFLKAIPLISDLSLRASYGLTGSQAIEPYATMSQLYAGKNVFGDALYTTYSPSENLAADLKWETTEQTNIGLEMALMDNRFRFTVDAYVKNTSDLLNSVKLPSSLGWTSTLRNVGEIQNKGMEFSANARALTGDFKLDFSANISFNRSKVTALYGGQDILGVFIITNTVNESPNLLREGEPFAVFYGYLKDGYDANGKEKYQDLSGSAGIPDGIINQYDKTIIGDPNPDFIYGFNTAMSFKNFEFNFFIQGSQGNDICNFGQVPLTLDYGMGLNKRKEVLNNTWTSDNPNAKYPKASSVQTLLFSDRFIEDGSYLRLRSIRLAYNLPLKKWGVNGMRNAQVYASGQNLLTFTKYSGWDPEINSYGGSSSFSQGIDNLGYPTSRTITFGVKVGF